MSKDSKIPAAVTDLAAALSKKMSVVDGKLTIDPNAYVESLPESLSVENVKQVHEYNSHFYPAVTLAAGQAAIQHMKKDKKIDAMSLEVPLIAKDHFDLTIERHREFPNPQKKADGSAGEPIQAYGNVKASIVVQAARGSRGLMTHVRNNIAEDAMKAFAK